MLKCGNCGPLGSNRVRILKKKYSVKRMFYKALYSSTVGFPISMGLNAALLHWIPWVIKDFPWLAAAIIIGIPYFIASVFRQFFIDYVYQKYNVMIDPKYLIEVLAKRIKEEFRNEHTNTGSQ